jgi:hypothetical protein
VGGGGGGGGANGGGDGGDDDGAAAPAAGAPVIELKSRVNSPGWLGAAGLGGGGGAGGTTGAAGGGACGAAAVGTTTGAIGCVIAMVAPAAEGGGATGGDGGGGGGATFPAAPLPMWTGCVDPGRGACSSGRRIVTLICFAPAADAPLGVCDESHTSSDSKPCRNCVTTTGCPSTSSNSISLSRSMSGNARTRASIPLFSSTVPTR